VSIQDSITTLKTLQVLDLRIAKLEEELSTERVSIDEKSERHLALVTHAAKLESTLSLMEGTKGELNGELRQHLVLVEKSREKMTRCRNEKEANAAQREVEEVRRLCRERETEISKLAGLIDDGRIDLAKVEAEREEVASQIDETHGEATAKVRELQTVLDEQLKKRAEAMSQLSSLMQRRYEAVQKKRGTGAAALIDGSCTACHISLSPMLYQEIMRLQELHECPSCHRLLYLAEKGSADDPNAVAAPDPHAES
jgi:uncharacterized protein